MTQGEYPRRACPRCKAKFMPQDEAWTPEESPKIRTAVPGTGTKMFQTEMQKGWWVVHHHVCLICGKRFKLNEFIPDAELEPRPDLVQVTRFRVIHLDNL